MRNWEGIQLNTAATDPGSVLVVNPSFYVTGEMKRRSGLVNFTNQSGVALTNFQNPFTGYFAVFATSTGTVEAVSAP